MVINKAVEFFTEKKGATDGIAPAPVSLNARSIENLQRGGGNPGEAAATDDGPKSQKYGTSRKYTDKLTSEQVEEIQESYYIFEQEEKGLDVKNVKSAMKALGFEPTKDQLKTIMVLCDPDRDGFVEVDEFTEIMAFEILEKSTNDELRMAFALFDKDKSGKISLEDLKKVVKDLGEALSDDDLAKMIQAADADGDGEIDEEEYINIMKRSGF
eukprot:CAMPEP_0184706960 /NCGR_PEP_ID=MMETSP0313-20130426/37027_1 /TAXON_ID=2792 /ORGANISM="Porphyridium aerugineum, Strain SAG 1380-2" /LENGTH=212 /DNA_ID=CAMNT_0027168529 /DNA_START=154 /DNA_END=792 /DNA_ORIENTATION=+